MCIQINDHNRRRVRRTQALLRLKGVNIRHLDTEQLRNALDAAVVCHLLAEMSDELSKIAKKVQAEINRRRRQLMHKQKEAGLNERCFGIGREIVSTKQP